MRRANHRLGRSSPKTQNQPKLSTSTPHTLTRLWPTKAARFRSGPSSKAPPPATALRSTRPSTACSVAPKTPPPRSAPAPSTCLPATSRSLVPTPRFRPSTPRLNSPAPTTRAIFSTPRETKVSSGLAGSPRCQWKKPAARNGGSCATRMGREKANTRC